MDRVIFCPVKVSHIMNLGMTIMTSGDAVIGSGFDDLVIFELTITLSCFSKSRLQETTASAATIVVGFVWCHFNDILFTHNRFDHEAKIICYFISITLTYDLTRILNGKGNFTLPVPVGTGFESAFPNPLSVIGID